MCAPSLSSTLSTRDCTNVVVAESSREMPTQTALQNAEREPLGDAGTRQGLKDNPSCLSPCAVFATGADLMGVMPSRAASLDYFENRLHKCKKNRL